MTLIFLTGAYLFGQSAGDQDEFPRQNIFLLMESDSLLQDSYTKFHSWQGDNRPVALAIQGELTAATDDLLGLPTGLLQSLKSVQPLEDLNISGMETGMTRIRISFSFESADTFLQWYESETTDDLLQRISRDVRQLRYQLNVRQP